MRTLLLKRMVGSVWNQTSSSRQRDVILLYHSVGTGPWAMPLNQFEDQMAWLKKHASVVSLDELLPAPGISGLRVCLTFDDGYRSLYTDAAYLLKKFNFSAMVYLNTGCISDKQHIISDQSLGHYPGEEFMTWKEVEDLSSSGWLVGSHGVDHIDLTKADAETIQRQARDSKTDIETRLGVDCEHFSYTWGHHNRKIRDIITNAGYCYAVSGQHAQLLFSDDPFMLPRLNISREYTLNDFISVVTGAWDFIGVVQKVKRLAKKA